MKFNLAATDWWKVLKGAAIVGSAAALTYLSENMAGTDFGWFQPVVVATLSVVINILRKMVQDNPT